MNRNIRIWRLLGPGLIFAGAAVGVSHLVQSTRAGASYGYGLLWVLVLANILKYPFFEFGPRYAAVTGKSLIEGYRKLGNWAVVMFTIITVSTMFSIQAAVTIVTAGLAGSILGIPLDPYKISMIILFISLVVLVVGKYALLDKTIKIVIVILAFSTMIAAITALTGEPAGETGLMKSFSWKNGADILFIIAFAGWMPAPIDVSVWQSLWTVAKKESLRNQLTLTDALKDFRTGFIGTAVIAIFFMILGREVLYGTGIQLSESGLVFAEQLISIYTGTIGKWSYYVIAAAALTTMLSTTLTCLDAYPRVLKPITEIFFSKLKRQKTKFDWHTLTWGFIVATGALLLLGYLHSTMQTMVDIATTLSFITAPALAVLNYKVVTHKHMPESGKPGKWLKVYAWTGIICLSFFAAFFLYWRFFT
ncbi:MAG: Nramp family divalent metal transporter [Bacteroidales bacterium]|nr:Nramp family divalent metal transporter [Bacteroidales bacterium]